MENESRTWTIYRHINKINGKCYIGQTCQDLSVRFGKDGCNYSTQYFYRAIKKYGWENFEHEILEENIPSFEEANIRERYWIAHFHSCVLDSNCNGYNADFGGSVLPVSEETKEKISNSLKGNIPWNKGKKLSEEHVQHLRESHAGQTSPCKGKPSSRKGKKLPEKTVNKMRSYWKNNPRTPKQIEQLNNLHKKMRERKAQRELLKQEEQLCKIQTLES